VQRNNIYTFIFAAVISISAAFILSIASSALNERQRLNVEADIKKNILIAVGLMSGCECKKGNIIPYEKCCV